MKEFIGLLVLALVIAAPAFAADMPVPALVNRAPLPPPPALVFSWIDWYMGGNAGYGWGSGTNPNIATDPFDSPRFASVGTAKVGNAFLGLLPNGFIGGQIGYDWQINPEMGGQSRSRP
jgi:outer membrane immunogenic protein